MAGRSTTGSSSGGQSTTVRRRKRQVPTDKDESSAARISDASSTPSEDDSSSTNNTHFESKPRLLSNWKWRIRIDLDAPIWLLTFLAFLSRYWRLDHPRSVVLDEMVYGNYVAMYQRGQFFFDKGPMLGKQLIALAGYVAGYDGADAFSRVGEDYRPDTPVWHLRAIPALAGALTVPLAYSIVKTLGYANFAALLAGSLILLDTAFLTISRFVLLDSILVFFGMLSVFCALRFNRCSIMTNGRRRVQWAALLGLSTGAAISVKFAGIATWLFVMWLVAQAFWHALDDRSLSAAQLRRQLGLCLSAAVVLPVVVHMLSWSAHILLLTRAGPYDQVMSARFQASLEGGLSSLAHGQPYNISFGSQISLRNGFGVEDKLCWLHSHTEVYPIRYEDERGSSHQQQVTCYSHKDSNNFFIVKHPDQAYLHVDNPAVPVSNGDVIQLVHGLSGRLLNSHDVAAPLTPDCQEVSCYIDYNISMEAEPNWIVRLYNVEESSDSVWHPVVQQFQLIHQTSGQALVVTGKQLPEWAFSQWEIAATRQMDAAASFWIVEEHRYINSKPTDEAERKAEILKMDLIPTEAVYMRFTEKLSELLERVFMSRKESAEDHLYSSWPLEWLIMTRGIAYWLHPISNAQVHLIGNVVTWYLTAAIVAACCLILGWCAIYLQYQRGKTNRAYAIDPGLVTGRRFATAAHVLLGAFFANYLPHFICDNSLFVNQYLPALAFGIVFVACVIEEILELAWRHVCAEREESFGRSVLPAIAVWLATTVYVFYKFVAFSYGIRSYSSEELATLEWKDTWEFIKRAEIV